MRRFFMLSVCVLGIGLLITGCGENSGTQGSADAEKANLDNLKIVGIACSMFSADDEKYPSTLKALQESGHLEDQNASLWINKNTGETKPFIFCPGRTEADDASCILAAAPEAVNGKREVLHIDGSVEVITEEKFQKQAKKQNWQLP